MLKHYSLEHVSEMERFHRANFINCLTGFKAPMLIGTVNSKGEENLAIFNNLVHLGADPALIGFVNRPREAAPHTLANIEATGVYTINHVSQAFFHQAHQTSAKYPEGVSEFEKTGLTAEALGDCTAPFVKESPVKFSMQMKEVIPIQFNNTYFIIGAVKDIYVDNQLVEEDGCLNLQQAKVVASLATTEYFSVSRIDKLGYAKPQ